VLPFHWTPLALLCAPSFLFIGAFWWARNVADYGNPFGIFRLTEKTQGGESLSTIASHALAFAFDPFALASWKLVVERAGNELGLPLLIILAQLALWPAAVLVARGSVRRGDALVAGLLAVGTVVIFIVTPTSARSGIQLRLGFPALGPLAMAAALAATRVRLPEPVSAFAATAAAVLAIGYSRVFYLGVVVMIVAATARNRRPTRLATAALVCLVPAGLIAVLFAARQRRARNRAEFYGPSFAYAEQNIGQNERVGYFQGERSYFFFGTTLKREVRYVPPPHGEPTPQWFAQLRADGIRAVFVGPYDNRERERRIVERLVPPHGELVPVFGNGRPGQITVYRFADATNPP
jgi:hypothetical protein